MQAALRMLYPSHCVTCDEMVEGDFGICPACWGKTHFIDGLTCDGCGVPLMGDETAPSELCDDCMTTPRPWSQGRAAMMYRDNGRRLVLGLKHGDRQDIARPAGPWMAQVAAPLLRPDMVVAPVPLHWIRLLKRRYNQSALLSASVAEALGLRHMPDLLTRPRRTKSLDGLTKEARFAMVADAMQVNPRRADALDGQAVLLIDDVLTSGATLGAATQVCLAAGATEVCVLTLARAAKET